MNQQEGKFVFVLTLPNEVVDEIFPHLTSLRSNICLDNNGMTTTETEKFDYAVGSIVNNIVSYDMGWMGKNKSEHDCRHNFNGSAKAMESDVGDDLINNSIILKETGLNVRVVIGDEDSTTISAVRRGNPLTMFKLAD
ncbi:hypothetical protein PV325_013636, partial [Microctonus aethiopoides]